MSLAQSRAKISRHQDISSDHSERLTIGEMARAFNVSLRTLRFYEDRGLLIPQREGSARYYAARDKDRLTIVLKGKQLGFTLTEISDMLDGHHKQADRRELALKPEQIVSQIAHLERQRAEIDGAILALRSVQQAGGDAR